MTTTATTSTLTARIERVRRMAKGRERATSAKLREQLAALEQELVARPADRDALEQQLTDSILDVTPSERREQQQGIADFDAETKQGEHALRRLRTLLDDAIAEEAKDEATQRINRQLNRAREATQLLPEIDAQMRALAAQLRTFVQLQYAWREDDRWLQQHARERNEAEVYELVAGEGLMPRRFWHPDVLLDRDDYTFATIRDEQVVWPMRSEDIFAPDPDAID
jgi:hypothetical protein